MRPAHSTPLILTRKALGTRFARFAALVGIGQRAATGVAGQLLPILDSEGREKDLEFKRL